MLSFLIGAVNTDMQDQWAEAYGTPGKMFEMLTLAIGRDPEQGSYSGMCVDGPHPSCL